MKRIRIRFLAVLVAVCVMLTTVAVSAPAYADDTAEAQAEEIVAEEVKEAEEEIALPPEEKKEEPASTESEAPSSEEQSSQSEEASQDQETPDTITEGSDAGQTTDAVSAKTASSEAQADDQMAADDAGQTETESVSAPQNNKKESASAKKDNKKDTASGSKNKSDKEEKMADLIPQKQLMDTLRTSVLFAGEAFDNSTTLPDGEYQIGEDTFEFAGGTGKAKLTLEKVVVKNQKATAVFKASSASMTHIYLHKAESSDETIELYNPDTDQMGTDVYKIKSDRTAEVPVRLNEKVEIAARTVAMSDPHWVNYTYRINLTGEDLIQDDSGDDVQDDPQTGTFDNTTSLSDGTYTITADNFSFTGGTGKAKLTLEKVVVKDHKATAVFKASSTSMTHAYLYKSESNEEQTALYDPDKDTMGPDVYAISDKQVEIPVRVNEDVEIAVRTVAMTAPHWVNYVYHITVTEEDKDSSSGDEEPTDPVTPADPTEPEQPDTPVTPAEPSTPGTLSNGTYKVNALTAGGMFYLEGSNSGKKLVKCVLEVKDGKMYATIVLSGKGYDYVYMGTPEQAKKAGKNNWVPAVVQNGYYTYRIPVAALDKQLAITPRSAKYAADGTEDPWRPGKTIIFYSSGAELISAEEAEKPVVPQTPKDDNKKEEEYATHGEQTEFENDKKAANESKWADDSSKSTSRVDNSTTLKDGVYTPTSFSWSGGSGKLAYIRCNKITVKNGQAIATIEFSSTKYDQLKANGRIYYGTGVFTIPVKLNANNVIVGRTTAMSQPHWVQYVIYIGLAEGQDGALSQASKNELSDEAPVIAGLSEGEEVEIEHAKYFKMFEYENGIRLLEVDVTGDTPFHIDNPDVDTEEEVEYDEDGNPIAKSQTEITLELYQNNIVNYMLVPEDVEVPAGLEKDYIIVTVPSQKAYVASEAVVESMEQLGALEQMTTTGLTQEQLENASLQQAIEDETLVNVGGMDELNYREIVKQHSDLSILPAAALPLVEADDTAKGTDNEDEAANTADADAAQQVIYTVNEDGQKEVITAEQADEMKELIETVQSRFTALGVPVLIDRSEQEADDLAKAEWIKVYGALFGCDASADAIYQKLINQQ